MRFPLCIILIALMCGLPASAVRAASREVYLRLLSIDTQAVPDRSFAFDPTAAEGTPATEAPIKSYLNHQGTVMTLSGNTVVFSTSDQPEQARKPEMRFASVTLPAEGNAFILVFLPNGNGRFKVLPLSDAVEEFPLGAVQVVNLSKTPIKLTLEKTAYGIKPGAVEMIKNPPLGESQQSAMTADVFKEGKWQRFNSGSWPPPGKNKRLIEIFFENPETGTMKLRGFRDISPSVSSTTIDPPESTEP